MEPFDFVGNRRELEKASAEAAFEFYKSVRAWRYMVTLTFENVSVGPDVAWAKWRALVRYLNKNLFGAHYTKAVGHSYFSYLLGIEYQRRGTEHFHVLIDKPIDFDAIHTIWKAIAGFAWVERVKNPEQSLRYVTKYILKGGENVCYRSYSNLMPRSQPIWWKSDNVGDVGSGHTQQAV